MDIRPRSLLAAALLALLAVPAAANEAPPPHPGSKNEHVLTNAQRDAVLHEVRACWRAPRDVAAADENITLLVIVNENGDVLDATVVPEDQDRVDTPALRGFARSVLDALTDPRCTHLNMPNGNVGTPWLFRLRFTPGA